MQLYDVAAYQLRGLLRGFVASGIDTAPLLAMVGIAETMVNDPEARFPEPQMMLLWMCAEQRWTHADPMGLTVGSRIPYGGLELIDYLLGSSATAGEALTSLARYTDLCASGFHYHVDRIDTDDGEAMRFRLDHYHGLALAPPGMLDYLWTVLITRFREHTVPNFAARLHTRVAPRGPVATYKRVLGNVHFECEHDELIVPLAQWTLPNPRADAGLGCLLARHANDVLARRPQTTDFLNVVRAAVADGLRLGDVSIEHTAQRVAMSPRTFQRRLADEGAIYKDLVDDVRLDFARAYLTRTALSLQDIGNLLAYSDQTAFQRAFRRWTSLTPAAYRRAYIEQTQDHPAPVSPALEPREASPQAPD